MKYKLTIFFSLLNLTSYSQTSSINKIEDILKKRAYEGKFDKLSIDLNADTKEDLIYSYQCGEPNCILVYLNTGDTYKEVVNENCNTYSLWEMDGKKVLHLELLHCCGESPYISNRTFEFNPTASILKENYVLTNATYLEESSLLTPKYYISQPWRATIRIDNYNLRFSPTIENLKDKDNDKESFTFGYEEGTNIIGKIKINSQVKVLAELIERDRKWLFVEVEKSQLSNKNTPLDFDFQNQKLRGWISDKYVKKE